MKEKSKTRHVLNISLVIIVVFGIVFIRNSGHMGEQEAIISNSNKEQVNSNEIDVQENIERVIWSKDKDGRKVPIPKGYIGSNIEGENKIESGYVIYEGTEEIDNTNEEKIKKAQNERNQFVWVPIEDINSMYGIDENGKKWGKLYEFTVEGIKPLNWSQENGIMSISKEEGYREPDIIKSHDTNKQLSRYNMEIIDTYKFKSKLEAEFEQMILSVEKYGGFYIGRYETGNLSKNIPKVTKQNMDIHGQTWYVMYQRSKKIANENENILTSMIWGCQWDATLKWINETGNKDLNEIIDSSSWGNYANTQLNYFDSRGKMITKKANSNVRIPTGSSEKTKSNNIYDMAGNVCDRTIEANSTFLRIGRRRTLL